MEKYFLTQIKCTNGTWEKGCVVKDTLDECKQAYHAYLGAYAYGHDEKTNYVQCHIANIDGAIVMGEVWKGAEI